VRNLLIQVKLSVFPFPRQTDLSTHDNCLFKFDGKPHNINMIPTRVGLKCPLCLVN